MSEQEHRKPKKHHHHHKVAPEGSEDLAHGKLPPLESDSKRARRSKRTGRDKESKDKKKEKLHKEEETKEEKPVEKSKDNKDDGVRMLYTYLALANIHDFFALYILTPLLFLCIGHHAEVW